jgi:hypothetical protein
MYNRVVLTDKRLTNLAGQPCPNSMGRPFRLGYTPTWRRCAGVIGRGSSVLESARLGGTVLLRVAVAVG